MSMTDTARPCPDCPLKGPNSRALTPRQQAVADCIAKGMSNKEIARHLKMEIGTVKMTLHLVFGKTGAKNRTMLAILLNDQCRTAGVLPQPEAC